VTSNVVIAFGRFNPPTIGHGKLVDFVLRQAAQRGAAAVIFPSQTEKERKTNTKNPLPFREKVGFLKQFFPQIKFNENTNIKTIFDALAMLSLKFDQVSMVAGSDRASDFAALSKYIKPKGRKGGDFIILKKFEVIPVPGDRDPDSDAVEGMSASKMRQAAVEGNWKAFQAGVPTRNVALAKQLYASVKKHMGLTESTYRPNAFLLYGFSPTVVEGLQTRLPVDTVMTQELQGSSARVRNIMEMCDPMMVDVTDQGYADILHIRNFVEQVGYAPTIYICGHMAGPITESWIGRMTTSGLIRKGMMREAVVLDSHEAVLTHATRQLKEADAKPGGLKTPSEVDRLKDTQKQQIVLTKQRQAQELLQAKQRELAKKSREDMNKITTGGKPGGSAR
jgi:hypothetical protein